MLRNMMNRYTITNSIITAVISILLIAVLPAQVSAAGGSDATADAVRIISGGNIAGSFRTNANGDAAHWVESLAEKKEAIKAPAEYANLIKYSASDGSTSAVLGKTCGKVTMTYGTGEKDTLGSKFDESATFDLTKNEKGGTGVIYRNCFYYCPSDPKATAKYKGQKGFVRVDVKAVAESWSVVSDDDMRYDLDRPYLNMDLSQTAGNTGVHMVNVKDMRIKYSYYYAGTSTPVKVKSNVTYNDIDNCQAMSFKCQKVYKALVTDKPESVLRYAYDDGWHVFVDPEDTDAAGRSDPQCSASIAYESEYMNVKYTSNQTTVGDDIIALGRPNGANSYFSPSQYTLFLSEPGDESLVKAMTDSDETLVQTNRIRNENEEWTAVVSQQVPAGYSTNSIPISRFIVKDNMAAVVNVEKSVENKRIKVTNADGKDITDQFTYSASENLFTAEAKPSLLGNEDDFYNSGWGNTITFEVTVCLKEGLSDEELEPYLNTTRTEAKFPDEPSSIVDNYELTGEPCATILELPTPEEYQDPDDEIPGLYVIKTTEPYEFQVGQKIPYTIEVGQKNPLADATRVVIKDTDLPDGLTIDDSTLTAEGPSSEITLTRIEGGFEVNTPLLKYGEVITISFEASAEKEINGTVIPNTVTAKAFGVPEVSDSTSIYINSPKIDVKKNVTKVSNTFSHGDQINYEIEVTNLNKGTFMRNILIADTFGSDGLVFDKGSLAVENEDGKLLVNGRDYEVTLYNKDTDEADGYPLEISDVRDGNSGEILPSSNHGGFIIRMTGAYSNLGYEDKYVPAVEDERGSQAAYGGYGHPDYENLDLSGKLKVSYNMTVEDETAADNKIVNFVRVPASENTNKDFIINDDGVPSGGDYSELISRFKGNELVSENNDTPDNGNGDKREDRIHTVRTGDRIMLLGVLVAMALAGAMTLFTAARKD